MTRYLVLTWPALVLPVLLAGCELPGKPKLKDQPRSANQIDDFPTLYRTQCSGCHGKEGNLGPAPPLNDPLFLAIVPEEQLLKVVTGGRSGYAMPAFGESELGPLTEKQVKAVVSGLKSAWPPKQSADGVPTYRLADAHDSRPGRAKDGFDIYGRACASCHGKTGEGGTNEQDKKIGAINDRTFLSLISDQALRRIVITGRPDLGMPSYEKTLGESPRASQDVADLVALLIAWREGKGADK